MGQLGEKLGVSGEGDTGLVDHALVHRGGDHPGEVAVDAAVAGAQQGLQHVAGVARVELAGDHCCGQRRVPHVQTAGRRRSVRPGAGAYRQQGDVQTQQRGAFGQQLTAGDRHQGMRLCRAGQQQAQVGTDAGRLAGRQGKALRLGHRRIST
ncbi:hypothetical protein D3C78_1426490 [compost metagenome]